jgi:HK97 family phage portal protein
MDWVMDCVRFTADTVSNAEYHFEKDQGVEAYKIPGTPENPPQQLLNLMRNPNPYADYIEMMDLLVIDLLLVGNAYWMKWRTNEKGQPLAFYRLAPPYVEVATAPWGVAGYYYQIPNADKLYIEPEEVVHFKLSNPDPANPFYGVGLISGAGRAADLEIALTDSQGSYFENHAMPSMSLESARRVPRDVFKKMRAQLRARAQGPKNSGELLVLEAGLKLNPITPNAMETAFAELSKMSRNRVFSWFRLNPVLLGIEDEHTKLKIGEAQRQFDMRAARPLMNRIQSKISSELTQAWDLDYVLDYEYQLDPEEQATLGATYAKTPGVTVNEVRKFSGLEPHPDKEIGEITLNLPGAEGGTGQPGETKTRNGFPDRGLPGEKGREPNGENTKRFPKKKEPMPVGAKARRAGEGKSIEEVIAEIKALPEGGAPVSDPGPPVEDTLFAKRTSEVDDAAEFFEEQLRTAASALADDLGVTGLEPEGKSVVKKLRSSDAWETFKGKVAQAYEQALGKVMSAAVIHHSHLNTPEDSEVDYKSLIEAEIKHGDTGVAAITKTFQNLVTQKVKGLEDPAEVRNAIKEAVGQWVDDNAKTIALTEATRGYNLATLGVAGDAGHSHVLVSDGTDFDQPCAEANGSVWTIEKATNNLLQHPNCRRAFVPVTAPESE